MRSSYHLKSSSTQIKHYYYLIYLYLHVNQCYVTVKQTKKKTISMVLVYNFTCVCV